MTELKSSNRSHKTGTLRGDAKAEETIPLLPLCQVTIMYNKDKWLALKKKKACGIKTATFNRGDTNQGSVVCAGAI